MRRNPNNYGCVTKLSGNRSRPWMVKVTVYDEDGFGKQVPIDYAETEEQAKIILAQYNDNPWNIGRKGAHRAHPPEDTALCRGVGPARP